MSKKILFFSSETCNPCNQVKKLLSKEIIKELNIVFYSAEDDFEIFVENEVKSVPTFISKVNNIEKNRAHGFKTIKELKNL
tara:strand:+ start:519 stop:761 length:243 start_codon:yes stop_codon:yes gene_type:complete